MKNILRSLCVVALLMTTACFTTTHTVGGGPTGSEVVQARQWYLLFGLVSLNGIDSENLAGNATSYRVTTQWSFVDVLLNLVTSIATIQSRTISVEK